MPASARKVPWGLHQDIFKARKYTPTLMPKSSALPSDVAGRQEKITAQMLQFAGSTGADLELACYVKRSEIFCCAMAPAAGRDGDRRRCVPERHLLHTKVLAHHSPSAPRRPARSLWASVWGARWFRPSADIAVSCGRLSFAVVPCRRRRIGVV